MYYSSKAAISCLGKARFLFEHYHTIMITTAEEQVSSKKVVSLGKKEIWGMN